MFRLTADDKKFFVDYINELLKVPEVRQMDEYPHHGNTTCLGHSLSVAYKSYFTAKKYGLRSIDYHSLIRGALLHDFFLYDWHDPNKGFRLHGYKHPRFAYNNAIKYFGDINSIEKDIILKHMWPLTIFPPKYLESIIVCFCDKVSAFKETIKSAVPVYKGVALGVVLE